MANEIETITPECIGSQTVGPFYGIGLNYLVSETMARPDMPGRHVTIEGTLFDADGKPVPDGILELWQASPDGIYVTQPIERGTAAPESFSGFARLSTHHDGRFRVHTMEPGSVPYGDGHMQAPHIVVLIFMRGLMRHLVTRIYFPQHPMNLQDPVLSLVPPARSGTLIAHSIDSDASKLLWDIHLQGEKETVFFEC